MSRQKKHTKKLAIILGVALAVLLLELAWLAWTLFGTRSPSDSDVPSTGETVLQEQQETLPPESSQAASMPWESMGGKQPVDYTWEEYQALSDEQQKAFREYLGDDGFEAWLDYVQDQTEANPWEQPGAKEPENYTWEEFEALTGAQQMAFQNYLGIEGFAAWMDRAQSQMQAPEMPWEQPGAKQPGDYTREEYEALTVEQQMAFQNFLGAEGFAKWLDRVRPQTSGNPWEQPGAKQPADYTWEEFEALTAGQQMAFQNFLGADGFAKWLDKLQPQTGGNPWEEPGAKRPEDYTWEEFETLTAAQQIAFQDYLGEEAFEAWLNRVQNRMEQNPWEQPGAKRPEDYTWEEFEALTAAQQIAFQNYLGEAAFEAWLNRVQGG